MTERGSRWSAVAEDVFSPAAAPLGERGVALPGPRRRLDVFAVSGEGNLLHTRHDADGFAECVSLGGIAGSLGREWPVFGAISAFDAGLRGMGVVVGSMTGDLLLKFWNGAGWGPFAPMHTADFDPTDPALDFPRPPSGPPATCGGGSARADVFVRGPRGDLLHSCWDGNLWSALQSIGRPQAAEGGQLIPGEPIACAWGNFRLDVFATGGREALPRAG